LEKEKWPMGGSDYRKYFSFFQIFYRLQIHLSQIQVRTLKNFQTQKDNITAHNNTKKMQQHECKKEFYKP
jgi:hypothetical protein